MKKLKLNSSGISHTSNPFHAALHALKEVFNLRQVQTESMDYFYKRSDYYLATWMLTGCNATNFPGLEKHTDSTKDAGKCMAVMYLIEKGDPQRLSHISNEL